MNLHLRYRQLLVWGFIVITTVSAINILVQADSYSTLYSSISQLQFAMSSLSVINGTTSGPYLSVGINTTNHVNYSGLRISRASFMTNFVSGNTTLFPNSPILYAVLIDQVLLPQSTTIWGLNIRINSADAISINSFRRSHDGNVTAPTELAVQISSSFLDATANPGEYRLVQNLTLT